MQYRKADSHIELYRMPGLMLLGVVAIGFVCTGITLLFTIFQQEDGSYSANGFQLGDWLGVAFLCVWTCVPVWMACVTLFSSLGYKIIIDGEGVRETRWLFPSKIKQLSWAEIREYGYYFSGNMRGSGGMYTLYFSPQSLNARGAYRKKPARAMIQIDIPEDKVNEIAEQCVFAFCKQHTGLSPTTVEIKYHFM